MKQYIKSYHLFLTRWWFRGIIYLVYPTLLLFGAGYLGSKVTEFTWISYEKAQSYRLVLLELLCSFIVSVEIFCDYFIFGGIATKETNKLEYLKTSVKGITLLTKALITDGMRHLLSIAIIVGFGSLLLATALSSIDCILIIIFVFGLVEAGLIVTRHFSTLLIQYITLSVITFFLPASITLLLQKPITFTIWLPLLLAIVISFLGRWLILKKARNSYYDNRPENSL